jgi:hypothetical protein
VEGKLQAKPVDSRHCSPSESEIRHHCEVLLQTIQPRSLLSANSRIVITKLPITLLQQLEQPDHIGVMVAERIVRAIQTDDEVSTRGEGMSVSEMPSRSLAMEEEGVDVGMGLPS